MLPPPTVLSTDPVATLAADAARRAVVTQPTIAELVGLAIAETDFLGELTARCDTMKIAADYADAAADRWEDALAELPGSVLPTLIEAVRGVLRRLADDVVDRLQRAARDELYDEIDAAARRAVP